MTSPSAQTPSQPAPIAPVPGDDREARALLEAALTWSDDAIAVLEVDYEMEERPIAHHRWSNPALGRLLGLDVASVAGLRLGRIAGLVDNLDLFVRESHRFLERRLFTLDVTFRRPDGVVVDVEARVSPMGNGERPRHWVATLRDITSRKRDEEAVRRSESQLRQAQHLAGFVRWQQRVRDGCILPGEGLLDLHPFPVQADGTIAGEDWWRRVHPDDIPAMREAGARLLATGEPQRIHFRLRRPDGSLQHITSISAVVPTAHGKPEWIHGVSVDDTAQQEREATLVRLREEALAAADAKSEFLANMSHEIRTPFNGVLGTLELLMETALDARQTRWVRTAYDSARALLELLDDVLDLSKIEAGHMELHAAPFSPATLVQAACELLRRRAEEKGLALLVEIDDRVAPVLLGDALRLRQVLLNLVGNAVKFTEQGTVRVQAHVVARGSGRAELRLAVHDTGIGIAPEQRARLFRPFTQLDQRPTRRFGGTGLGLSISRELVTMMGGTIHAESEPGIGSRFVVVVPLPVTDLPVPRDTRELSVAPHDVAALRTALAGRRILVVEDQPVNRMVVAEMLAPLALPVDLAETGADAVRMVAATAYDLVFMDVQMPVMDGLAATRAIRAAEGASPHPRPRIVAMTANAMRGDRERCLEAGMDDHLAKPLTRRLLFAMLDRQLAEGRIVPRVTGEHALPPVGPASAAGDMPQASDGALGAPRATTIAPADHDGDRLDPCTELRTLMHALSNAAQGEDFDLLRRRAAAVAVFARRVGDEPLTDAARALVLVASSGLVSTDEAAEAVRALGPVAQAAHDRLGRAR
jgi:PAS domain S-box-containing protein